MRRRAAWSVLAAGCASLTLLAAAPAESSSRVQYGIQDDAWLLYGPGSLDSRLTALDRLGVDIVRFYLRWDQVARQKPANPATTRTRRTTGRAPMRSSEASAGVRIEVLASFLGTPGWANGRHTFNWAPDDNRSFMRGMADAHHLPGSAAERDPLDGGMRALLDDHDG